MAEITGERRRSTENTAQYSWLLVMIHVVLTTLCRVNMNHVILSVRLLCRRKGFDFFYFTFLENKNLLKEGSLKIGEEQKCRVVR